MAPLNKAQAQRRADDIRAFRTELERLERDGALVLTGEQRTAVTAHHDRLLAELARDYDIDRTTTEKRLSLGMRVVSFLGAVALCAAAFLFFYRVWGLLETWAQLSIVVAAPIAAVAGTEVAARRERTLYFAALLGLVAFACFVLNLVVIGRVFNVTPSKNAFLVWMAFGLALAYGHGLRLLLGAALLCFTAFTSATVASWAGWHWISFGERPETVMLAGMLLLAASRIDRDRVHPGFEQTYRVLGLLAVFLPVLILTEGDMSYLPWSRNTVRVFYQLCGFALAGSAIWIGIRRDWTDTFNMGSAMFVILLFLKYVDWWWNWMPKYLFFLVVGLTAIGFLLALGRMRRHRARG